MKVLDLGKGDTAFELIIHQKTNYGNYLFVIGEKNIPGYWNALRYEAISTLNGLLIVRSKIMYKDSLPPWEKEFFRVEKSWYHHMILNLVLVSWM